ncbi:MAG TPA: hypothetical protein VM432_07065, partial [Bdellovibrionales bacterium]|nr:hypothetical protein [Bdellovibrionales bacterium]
MSDVQELNLSPTSELLDAWSHLPDEDRLHRFRSLGADDAEDFLLALSARDQAQLFEQFSRAERRLWIRFLPPDDACDLLQEMPEEMRVEVLSLLDETARREVTALLSYREDEAGGLMSPRFARVRPEMLVAEAIRYVRQ